MHHVCYLNGTSVEQFFAGATGQTHQLHLDGSLTYTGEPRLSPHSHDVGSGNVEDRTSPSSKHPQLHSGVSGSHDDIWAGLAVHSEPVAVTAVAVPVRASSVGNNRDITCRRVRPRRSVMLSSRAALISA